MATANNAMEREAPRMDAVFWAKRSIGYGGSDLDRGQVLKLKGLPNDRLLLDLGYIAMLPSGTKTFPCRVCGAEFLEQSMRDGHGKARHETREFVPPPPPVREPNEHPDMYQNRLDAWAQQSGAMADAHVERQEKVENEVAPLDLTKTTATRS